MVRVTHHGGNVAQGFYDIYTSIGTMAPGQQATSAPGAFAAEVAQAAASGLAAGLDPASPLVVTGHSLGGALATLLVTDLNAATALKPQAWTFASPQVVDAKFAARYGGLSTVSWRIYNQVDVVPHFPVDVLDSYQPVTTGYAINSLGKAKWSLSCAHSLNTYMHVLSPATVPLDQACTQLTAWRPVKALCSPGQAQAGRQPGGDPDHLNDPFLDAAASGCRQAHRGTRRSRRIASGLPTRRAVYPVMPM